MSKPFDVLIVGGGIAGASLAARLAGRVSVLLVESEALCGAHATGRSAAFWEASLSGPTPERQLSLASKPFFDRRWPQAPTPLLRQRGAIHLTGAHGETFGDGEGLPAQFAPRRMERDEVDAVLPGARAQWTGAWYEEACADIDVAALHAACLAEAKRGSARVATGSGLESASWSNGSWQVRLAGDHIAATTIVNAAGAWGDEVAARCGVAPLGLQPKRRTVVQLRVGRSGLKDLPFVTDLHQTFYFKGEADRSVWVCPLDESDSHACDAAPEELDVAVAIDRFERAVDWPVEAVERKWAGLRTFAPDRGMKFGFDADQPGFFWCVGQGGMGIQTAPAASLLCANLLLGEPLDPALAGIDPADFAPRSLRAKR